MHRRSTWIVATSGIATLALFTAGCAGESSSSTTSDTTDGGTVSVALNLTSDPLVPMTLETFTTRVMDMVYTGLVRFDDELKPYNANAESITVAEGSKSFDIKLKKDYTFSDGTPVTADSYIDAWNYTAYGPNATQSASLFNVIEGYDAVHPSPPDGSDQAPAPTAETLSGLKKVNDYEFTVTLSKSLTGFPVMLGYSPFYPLPKSFFEDPKAFEEKPIGNGPYTVSKLVPGREIDLVKRPDYTHEDAGKAAGINFISFPDPATAYTAVQGGQIDFAIVPQANLKTFESDFPDHNVTADTASMMDMQIPLYEPRYADPNVRIAISKAIDREAIVNALLAGMATPAAGWVAPPIPGYIEDACGPNCTYDPAAAKDLWAKTSFTGDIIITTVPEQKAVFTAVCQSITDTLGVTCNVNSIPTRTGYKAIAQEFKLPGPIRWGWNIDYPNMENMLGPKYQANGSSNWMKYDSDEFQAAMNKANAEPDPETAATFFNEAQKVLGKDMPDVPLYFNKAAAVWSENTTGVVMTGFAWPNLLEMSKTS